jgi:CHAT domain-containing protein
MSNQSSQMKELVDLQALQSEASVPFLRIARTPSGQQPADQDYESFFALSIRQLEASEAYNSRWEPPFELQPIAKPIVQQMIMYADHLVARGERDRAAAHEETALQLTDRYLGAVERAEVHRDRARELAMLGRFNLALTTLSEVRDEFVRNQATVSAMKTTLDIANVREWLGDYERALDDIADVTAGVAKRRSTRPDDDELFDALMRQMESIEEGEPDNSGFELLDLRQVQDQLLQARARLARFAGKFDLAEDLLTEVRPILAAIGMEMSADFHLAAVRIGQARFADARRILDVIAGQFSDDPMLEARIPALRILQADAALGLGEPSSALALVEDGLMRLTKNPDADLLWKLRWRKARAFQEFGDTAGALAAYQEAALAADELRRTPLGYRLDTTFFRDKAPMIEAAVALSVDAKAPIDTARLVELAKGRALGATLSVPTEQRTSRSGDDERFEFVNQALDGLAFRESTEGGSAALNKERRDLLKRREDIIERLRLADPRWRTLTVPPIRAPAATAQSLAKRGQSVLSLLRHGGRVTSVLYCAGDIRNGCVELSQRTERILEGHAENVGRGERKFEYDVSANLGLGLTDIVPDALLQPALRGSSLVVVPHGLLHLLPWAVMTYGDRRLVEYLDVGVLPNVSCLQFLDTPPVPHPSVGILGNALYERGYAALPEAGPELDDVARAHAGRLVAHPITGVDATASAFWTLVSAPSAAGQLLHICAHGLIDPSTPLASGLALTASRVDAATVLTSRVGFAEVVLSACSTGWRPNRVGGLELAGDDALGLSASFLEAGSRFLLVSITKAEDEATRAFMSAWHIHRSGGMPPLGATAATQRELLRQADIPVWKWAGITAYGCR